MSAMRPPRPLSMVTARLPAGLSPLDAMVDRLRAAVTRELRRLAGDTTSVAAERLPDLRLADYPAADEAMALFAVVRLAPGHGCGLLAASPQLAGTVTALLLGGTPSPAAATAACTALQRSLLERLFKLVLAALPEAFTAAVPLEPRLERLETSARFLDIAPPAAGAVPVRLAIGLAGVGGALDLVLPHAVLEQLGVPLAGRPLGGEAAERRPWRLHLEQEVSAARLRLEVVLDEPVIPLAELTAWQAGSLLPLSVTPASPVVLRAGDLALFRGIVGRRDDRVVVRVEDRAGGWGEGA